MLFICVNCRRIIGCSSGATKMDSQCYNCECFDACTIETPLNTIVARQVFFVHFPNGCEGHNKKPMGFKIGGKK